MTIDERKTRKKKVSGKPISIRPVNNNVWKLLWYHDRVTLKKNKITKSEYIEDLIVKDLTKKFESGEIKYHPNHWIGDKKTKKKSN